MKEQILQLLQNESVKIVSYLLNLLLAVFLIYKTIALKKIREKVEKTPTKIDDFLLDLLIRVTDELSGIDTGNIAIKDFLNNTVNKLQDKAVEKMGVRVEEMAKKEALPLVEKILDSVNDKVEKISVGGDYGLATNFQVAQIIKEQKDLLKKDVNGIASIYAETQFNKEGFNQGVLGATIQKTF